MKYLRHLCFLLLCVVVLHAGGYSQNLFVKNYKVRCDSTLNYFSSSAVPQSLFSVMAKYATGKADVSTVSLLDSLLEHPLGNMFWMYPVTGIYFYGKKNLSSAQKNKIINSFAHYNADTGITENHKLMFYSSLFLMSGEDEKDTLHWFNQKTSSYNNKLSGSLLKAWMNKAFVSGFAEFNSPHYGGFYLSPLLMLYDFSKDREIKSHAEILIWRILGAYVLRYHNSLIGGASSRVVDQDIFNKKNSQTAQLMGLFLGDKPLFNREGKPVNVNYHSLFFALSSFAFPETIYTMWKEEQKKPFEETDVERGMDKIRFYDKKSESITTYLYSDSLYSIGSIIEGHNDEIQTRTWSLDWAGAGENSTLFGLNPYMSKTDLATYFPGNIDTLYKNILKQRPFYNDTNKWIGGSPYENLFQYKNVLLGIYNFPDTLKNNSVSFFISDDIDSLKVEEDVLYAKTQNIYFALRFSSAPVISDVDYGKRYRIRGHFPAFALEVYPVSAYKTLNDFRRIMKQEMVRLILRNVSYAGLNGIQMQLYPNGEKHLNGEVYNLPKDTAYKSPFMNVSNGIMTIKTSMEKVTLDWGKQQVTYWKNQ